jgi:hypothetical protein
MKSSFTDLNQFTKIVPYHNGLVNGIIRPFQQDLHLVLRPDDIWLAIFTKFGFYVNGHAEKLCSLFVVHEGKETLAVDFAPTPLSAVDMGDMTQKVTYLIHRNRVDPELKDWIMPNFTTTTYGDKSVAAIVMMGTLQHYFEYSFIGGCGFPSATLLGEKSDWGEILTRVHRLPKYGPETTQWSKLLIPILQNIILSFTHPTSQSAKTSGSTPYTPLARTTAPTQSPSLAGSPRSVSGAAKEHRF